MISKVINKLIFVLVFMILFIACNSRRGIDIKFPDELTIVKRETNDTFLIKDKDRIKEIEKIICSARKTPSKFIDNYRIILNHNTDTSILVNKQGLNISGKTYHMSEDLEQLLYP